MTTFAEAIRANPNDAESIREWYRQYLRDLYDPPPTPSSYRGPRRPQPRCMSMLKDGSRRCRAATKRGSRCCQSHLPRLVSRGTVRVLEYPPGRIAFRYPEGPDGHGRAAADRRNVLTMKRRCTSKAARAVRRSEALRLHVGGHSFRQIAKEAGTSPATAHRDVVTALAEAAERDAELVSRYRPVALRRYLELFRLAPSPSTPAASIARFEHKPGSTGCSVWRLRSRRR